MEDDLKEKRKTVEDDPKQMEDDQKINKMEDDLKKSPKIYLMGCDTIVN